MGFIAGVFGGPAGKGGAFVPVEQRASESLSFATGPRVCEPSLFCVRVFRLTHAGWVSYHTHWAEWHELFRLRRSMAAKVTEGAP